MENTIVKYNIIKCTQDAIAEAIKNIYNISLTKFNMCDEDLSGDIKLAPICEPTVTNGLAHISPCIMELSEYATDIKMLIQRTQEMTDILKKLESECKYRIADLTKINEEFNSKTLDWAETISEEEKREESMENVKTYVQALGSKSGNKNNQTPIAVAAAAATTVVLPAPQPTSLGRQQEEQQQKREAIATPTTTATATKPTSISEASSCAYTRYKQVDLSGVKLTLPIATTLDKISPAFVWYEPTGKIYTCLDRKSVV